jgi:hypothetical protein
MSLLCTTNTRSNDSLKARFGMTEGTSIDRIAALKHDSHVYDRDRN